MSVCDWFLMNLGEADANIDDLFWRAMSLSSLWLRLT